MSDAVVMTISERQRVCDALLAFAKDAKSDSPVQVLIHGTDRAWQEFLDVLTGRRS